MKLLQPVPMYPTAVTSEVTSGVSWQPDQRRFSPYPGPSGWQEVSRVSNKVQ